MSSSISDIHSFSLSRRLVLPFAPLLSTLTNSLLHTTIQNGSSIDHQIPQTDLDETDTVRLKEWGAWEGSGGQRWEIAREDIVQMKKLKKLPSSVELDEPLLIPEFERPPYLSDEFILSRRHLQETAAVKSSNNLRKIVSSLASGAKRVKDDKAMDRLEEMPIVEVALGLKLEATRIEMEFMKKSAINNKKSSNRVPLERVVDNEDFDPVPILVRPELPSIGSPPIFARPPRSTSLASAIEEATAKVSTAQPTTNNAFSSPDDRLSMNQWNEFESIEPFSTPVMRVSQPSKIWSSSPISTPPSDGMTGPEKPIFPRAELDNNDLDELIKFPPRMSAYPNQEVDELASDEEMTDDSRLGRDLDRLSTSLKVSEWNVDQLEVGLEESDGGQGGLLCDSRLEIPTLAPFPPTTIPFPASLSEFALESPSIWSLKRPSGLRTLTIELDWQPIRVEIDDSPHEIFFREEEADFDFEQMVGSLTEVKESEDEGFAGQKLVWEEEEEMVANPRNQSSSDATPAPSPPTSANAVPHSYSAQQPVPLPSPSVPPPPQLEPNPIPVDSNVVLPSSSPGFIYPTVSALYSPESTHPDASESMEVDFPRVDITDDTFTSPVADPPGPLTRRKLESTLLCPSVTPWSTSTALSTFLSSRNHARLSLPPPIVRAPPPVSTISRYQPPTETRVQPDIPFVPPKFLSSAFPPSDSSSIRVIASHELIQLPLLYQSLLGAGIIPVDRPERPFSIPQPHLILDGKSCIHFCKLIRIVNTAQRDSLLERLRALSRGYDSILLILQENDGTGLKPYPFTKPVVEALGLLAVGLEGVEKECTVEVAFSESSEDSARLSRGFAEYLRAESMNEMWDERGWITDDPSKEELSLLQLEGLNSLSICYILSRCPFEQFVGLSKGQRREAFGRISGEERIGAISDEIARRITADQEEIQSQLASLPPSPSPTIQLEEVFSWERYET